MRWLLCAFVILLPIGATAQHMDKETFLSAITQSDPQGEALLLVYLQGTLDGLESANITLIKRGHPRLFCPPPDRILHPDWLSAELATYLKRYPEIPDNTSVPVIANLMLAEIYPCEIF